MEDYTDFQCSGGWLSAFKVRHGICRQKLQGEGGGILNSDIEVARLQLREDLQYVVMLYEIFGIVMRLPYSKFINTLIIIP